MSPEAIKARKAEKEAEEQANLPENVEFAFLVYRQLDGQLVTTNDINKTIVPMRKPTHDELYGTLNVLIKDMTAQQFAAMAAQSVLQVQTALAQQMMGQGQMQQIHEELQRERSG